MRRGLHLALLLLLFPTSSWAVTLRAEISAREVSVGENVVIRITATQEDGEPPASSPELSVQGKADINGPSVGSQRRVSMHNFSFTQEQSVIATWTVTPSAPGKLIVGPPTFRVGDKTVQGEPILIQVVDGPPKSRRQTGRPNRFDPFSFGQLDPFDPSGGLPFPEPRFRGPPEAPEDLKLKRAPHPIAFLYARTDQKKVVVGQPVTLQIYAYGSRGSFREVSPTEPSTAQFLSYAVVETSHDEPTYVTTIADEEWQVVKLRELILIPLQTGKLDIGSMTTILQGRGYPASGSRYGTQVTSELLPIEVVEPPLENRPEGYLLGDVGRFKLEAQVSPREIQAGDYVQVLLQLQGRGHLPTRVILPTRPGLEWEEPTLSGGPQVQNGKLQGTRTLKYAVRVTESGSVELGEARLPYFDPESQTYRTARVPLGKIEVAQGQPPPATAPSDPTDPAVSPATPNATPALSVRTDLSEYSPKSQRVIGQRAWSILLGAPALALLLRLLLPLLSKWRSRSPARTKGSSLIKSSLEAAQDAHRRNDRATSIRELERALYESIEEATGLRARAILKSHLSSALQEAGLDVALSEALERLSLALETARYDSSAQTTDSLLEDTQQLLTRLRKHAKSSARTRSAGAARSHG